MIYNLQMMIGLFLILIMAIRPLKLHHIPLIYLIASGLVGAFSPQLLNPYFTPSETDSALFALSNVSARSLLFTVIVFSMPKVPRAFFPTIAILNSLWVIFSPNHYGLGLAGSVDAMVLAIMYPYMLKYAADVKSLAIKLILIFAPLVAIFVAGGSVGIGGLTLALIILYARSGFYKFLLVPIVLFFTYYLIDPNLFSDSSRFVCWEWSMKWWFEGPIITQLFGTGVGTYHLLGPFIQVLMGSSLGNWYTLMHNDWLTCLFELGYVGFSIAASFFLYLCYKARHDRHLLASVVTFGACAVFYYPTKMILPAAFGVYLMNECLEL